MPDASAAKYVKVINRFEGRKRNNTRTVGAPAPPFPQWEGRSSGRRPSEETLGLMCTLVHRSLTDKVFQSTAARGVFFLWVSRVDPMTSYEASANTFRKQTSCPALRHSDGVSLDSGR